MQNEVDVEIGGFFLLQGELKFPPGIFDVAELPMGTGERKRRDLSAICSCAFQEIDRPVPNDSARRQVPQAGAGEANGLDSNLHVPVAWA